MIFALTTLAISGVPTLSWDVVNDTVMGGVSSGRTEVLPNAGVRFVGELSLDNNGGFVSIRSRPDADLRLGDARALRLRLRGDGRTWNVNAYRQDVPLRAGSYRTPVATVRGEVTEVTVHLKDFEASSFGRPVPGAPALDTDPGAIDQLGFLLSDKSPGPFALEVLSIEVIEGRRVPDANLGTAHQRLLTAIQAGVPAFNAGDHGSCRDTYRRALAAVVDEDALTDGERRLVGAALATAQTQDATAAAWTLRGAIDSVLAAR